MEIWTICWNFDINEMQETILKENIHLNKNMVVPQVIFSMSRWKLNNFSIIDNLKVVLVNFIAGTSIMKEFFYRFIVLYFNHFSKNISLTNIFLKNCVIGFLVVSGHLISFRLPETNKKIAEAYSEPCQSFIFLLKQLTVLSLFLEKTPS